MKGIIAAGTYTKERVECIHNLQVKEDDANPKYSKEIVKKYTKCVVVVIMHFQSKRSIGGTLVDLPIFLDN